MSQPLIRFIAARRAEARAILDDPAAGESAKALAWRFLKQHRSTPHA